MKRTIIFLTIALLGGLVARADLPDLAVTQPVAAGDTIQAVETAETGETVEADMPGEMVQAGETRETVETAEPGETAEPTETSEAVAPEVLSIYDLPYSVSRSCPNYGRLAGNTAVLFGGGVTMLIILQALPDDATAWNSKTRSRTPMFQRWYENVFHGPVFDHDNAIFNYVLHPYAGAAYYMSARSQGFNMWQSALYSFAISTFFWEYGIEAFNEIPSINDLIITPMGGMLLGEAFYLAKRHIVEHDYELLGTKWLGYPVAFLLDPVNECLGWFRGNNAHGYSTREHPDHEPIINMTPSLQPIRGGGLSYGFSMNITF